jgi:hypothetical protein
VAEEARSHRAEDGDGGDWLGDACSAELHLDVSSLDSASKLGWERTSSRVVETYAVSRRQAVEAG